MTSGPLQIESIADRVYAVLRERIVNGELVLGERLRQEALAEELGVSRTPLREALRRLASEGFVELQPHRGAVVSGVSEEDMRASFEARFVIEPSAARIAAEHGASEDGLRRMRLAIAEHRAARGDRTRSFETNRTFHLGLVSASGNAYLTRFSEILWASSIYAAVFDRQHVDAADIAAWADDHEAILDAIERRSADEAEARARAHIEASREALPG